MMVGGIGMGLGIDAGGTQTRWALASSSGETIASGQVAGLTALQVATESGREHIRRAIAAIAGDLTGPHRPDNVCAGITGYTDGDDVLRTLIAATLGLSPSAVAVRSDIEIAYLDLFRPGQGYVIYAGTGTIAAYIDEQGAFHRAGGRGAIIDDAGGGFWIAIEALRHIWRSEDAEPGSWPKSPMAVKMFASLGGSDWALTRQFVYQRDRGEIGELALAVAATADNDPAARDILQRAGIELARLCTLMVSRFGPKPMVLAGRVAQLHPILEQSLRAALPPSIDLQVRCSEAHIAAARIAAKSALTNKDIARSTPT